MSLLNWKIERTAESLTLVHICQRHFYANGDHLDFYAIRTEDNGWECDDCGALAPEEIIRVAKLCGCKQVWWVNMKTREPS